MKEEIDVPIDKAGRIVLPKTVRTQLAIEPGDLLRVSVQGSELRLHPHKATGGFVRKGQALVFASAGAALERETVQTILADTRGERTLEVTRGIIPRKQK